MNERWLPIAGFTGYEVSDLGRVRSYRKLGGHGGTVAEPRILKLKTDRDGYKIFNAAYRRHLTTVKVGPAALSAFVGPRPDGHECAHEDGDRGNNRIANLAWKTPTQNASDKLKHGTENLGERNHFARLRASTIKLIRWLHDVHDATNLELAEWFGISYGHAWSISTRKRWGHL